MPQDLRMGEGRGRDDVSLVVPADFVAIRAALATVVTWMSGHRPAAETGLLELVLAELLNNVAEHGYAGRGGRIDLSLSLCGRAVRVRIEDDGIPMPGLSLPAALVLPEGVAAPDLPEGGYGAGLIRAIVRDLAYARPDGRNRLTFRFDL